MSNKQQRNTHTIRQLTNILELDTRLLQWANDWAEGFGTNSPGHGEPGRGKNNVSRPVEAKPPAGHGLANECLQLHNRIHALIREITLIDRDTKRIKPIDPAAAIDLAKAKEPRNWGAGSCVVCDDYVPGINEDRLKLGMCPHHYRSFTHQRTHNPGIDRHAWIAAQRQALASVPEPGTDERPA